MRQLLELEDCKAAATRTASSPRLEAQVPLCTTARAERPGTVAMPNGERVFNVSRETLTRP